MCQKRFDQLVTYIRAPYNRAREVESSGARSAHVDTYFQLLSQTSNTKDTATPTYCGLRLQVANPPTHPAAVLGHNAAARVHPTRSLLGYAACWLTEHRQVCDVSHREMHLTTMQHRLVLQDELDHLLLRGVQLVADSPHAQRQSLSIALHTHSHRPRQQQQQQTSSTSATMPTNLDRDCQLTFDDEHRRRLPPSVAAAPAAVNLVCCKELPSRYITQEHTAADLVHATATKHCWA